MPTDADYPTVVRSRAPVRIDLAGGWSDVPPFAEREGGAVVNMAIDRHTHASLRLGGRGIRLRSDDYDVAVEAPDAASLHYDGTLDLLKAAVRRMNVQGPLELRTHSDVPPGSGLGTSAATAIAITGALDAAQNGRLDRAALAARATSLEIDELGIRGGKQDQLAAVYGGVNFLRFGAHDPTQQSLALAPTTIAALEAQLVLCYSGVSRVSGSVISQVQQAYEHGKPATVGALRELRSLAVVMRDVLLAGQTDEIGPLLAANWTAQLALHPAVTNDDVESLFGVARRNGALGGKACGAGGGGTIAFWAAPDAVPSLQAALTDAGGHIITWHLDQTGLEVDIESNVPMIAPKTGGKSSF